MLRVPMSLRSPDSVPTIVPACRTPAAPGGVQGE
jgi:hypothetical protein